MINEIVVHVVVRKEETDVTMLKNADVSKAGGLREVYREAEEGGEVDFI